MRRENAARAGRFYSIDEYDISRMLASSDEILELGRSCIAAQYRSGPVMQLLWRGITDYVMHYDIALMFGCASLPGTEPAENGRETCGDRVCTYVYISVGAVSV